MEESRYQINLNRLTCFEQLSYPDTFAAYRKAVIFLLQIKNMYIFEDELIEEYGDDDVLLSQTADGKPGIEAILAAFPDTLVSVGSRRKVTGEEPFMRAFLDLGEDYDIIPQDLLYDLFFTYKLRQTDIMELDNALDYFLENYHTGSTADFIRFIKLTLRKHGKKLLQPEHIETIEEWMAETEKGVPLSGTTEARTKGKPKRQRDDKITLLNQEQTALLIYCLRETKVIFPDEFLNNKEAGQAFSILTGYSADTIRQNLNKSELSKVATLKNVEVVEKALREVLSYIERDIKPE
jgi:hypothetical protein